MAHDLENAESMIYVGDQPWHKLGVCVGDKPVTVDAMIQALPSANSGLVYQPCYTNVGGVSVALPDTFAAVREVGQKVVGVVGAQAAQSGASPARLTEIARELLEGLAGVSTAGFLKGGSVMWIALKLGQQTLVAKDGYKDEQEYFFNLFDAFDNSMRTCGQTSSTRVVCANTARAALRTLGTMAGDMSIKHTASQSARLIDAVETWKEIVKDYETFQSRMVALSVAKIDDQIAEKVVKEILGNSESKRSENNATRILDLYHGQGIALSHWVGTGFGLFNACTEYADHMSVVRGGRDSQGNVKDSSRILDSVMLGKAAEFKDLALETIERTISL